MGRIDDLDPSVTDAARRWVVRLTSGEMTEREMARFKIWRSDPDCERAFSVEMANWRRLGQLREGLESTIVLPSAAELLRRKMRRWTGRGMIAVAATGSVLLAGPGLIVRAQADHLAGTQIEKVELPDGSRAILDAGTAIAVNFKDGNRRVEILRGRAWFNVSHQSGPTFEVAAARGVIQDIGTAFEVSRDGDRVETTVSKGRVRVVSPSLASVVLSAGQRATFAGDHPLSQQQGLSRRNVASWRSGNIVLEGVNVRHAIQEVARYRTAPTWVWGQLDQKAPITVVLRSDRPDAALEALAASENLSLLRLPGGAMIVGQIHTF
jgi:transmembrane sensor